MLIRRASKSDFESIWSIFQVVIEPGNTYVFAPDTSREDAFDYWFETGIKTFVIEDDEQIVGMYKLVTNQRDLGSHVANASFMVNPNLQGKGIGKLMGLHCIEEAKKAGYLAIQFNFVVSTNKPAVTLWEKLGFTIVGTLPKAFKHKELGYIDAYVMYRWLE
ncbi:GNAT family N-acetyltransferase [Mastigocoleus testarum]|uniref:Acetyltransferase n=1 Tax=Mastigocoleus testarum BC008 TaxID=371196 RepID=A0A0V7ZQD2_9CYAN|nr:GNAT family N-acetyltransferase [Mastigocoleus testarum]KST66304.1 acetyltransferase [Mastigocoleus testarum BC008]KST66625.1 acetyltransferase [Mastigocoleus testarum BC008]